MMFTVRVNSQIRIDHHDNDAAPRRVFGLAARWDPDLDPPVQIQSGADASTVIRNLGNGEGVSIASLGPALTWLERAEEYYSSTEPPLEGYRGPWQDAVRNMREAAQWLRQLSAVAAAIPTELTVGTAPDDDGYVLWEEVKLELGL
jgi:hypothetical protein